MALIATLFAASSAAQQISGSITGVVRDPQQAAIAGAKVTVTNQAQASTREVLTGSDGSFTVTPLLPAEYTVAIEFAGFKKFERKDIKIFANDRIVLPDLVLEVGAVTESVIVEGTILTLQAQSAERAGVITGRQVVDLAMSNRQILDAVRIIPGIVYTGGLGGIQANGSRGNQNNFTLDGVNNVDTGSNGGTHTDVNLDLISEFKVITNSQPAEFGRSSGAAINVVTKSGSSEFHGNGYWFHRHEGMNANNWRNNFENRDRQLQRRNWFGYTVGGPVLLPGNFNRNKDKLFFFFGQEFRRQLLPNGLRNVTVPTELERRGDFSQSFEGDGRTRVRVDDPANNKTPFPNAIIPASRLTADGVKILNFYPLPNALGRDPAFNYQSQISESAPMQQEFYRGDYNISEKWRVFGRFIKDHREENKPYGQWNADFNIPFSRMNFGTPAWSFTSQVTTVLNPTLTNEFVFGSSRNDLNIDPVDDTFNRSKLGLSYTMPFPDADKLGLVQNWRFGGVPNGPFTGFNGTPFRNYNHIWEFTDNVSKVFSGHTLKTGIYIHYSQKDQTAFTSVNGNIWFDRDTNNPGDTNWAFSNALLGNYREAQQSNVVHNGQYRNYNVEWYVQDNWKVTRNLTLDLGMRFAWIQPQYDAAGLTSSFNPRLYDGAAAAVLVRPVRNAAGQIVGQNPINGQLLPAALIASIVNTGRGFVNGVYANGMGREADDSYPQGLLKSRGIHYAPRLGIAYKLNDKMVIRAGGGIFYDRFQGNPVFDMLPNPPSTISPRFFYGSLSTLGSAQGTFFPAGLRGFDENGHVPTTYNWNFTIERELPAQITLDASYVGSVSHHQLARQDPNHLPFGSAWLPQNQDPNNANPTFDGRTTIRSEFYRPYQGYGGISITTFGSSSNYHSFQMAVNRRFARGMSFGVAYTWSKVLGTSTDDGYGSHPLNSRIADYGPLFFDRTHNLVFNYVLDVPKAARGGNMLDNPVGRAVFNNWQISGITNFQTGQPDNIGFGIAGLGGADVNRIRTGSETYGPRVVVNGNPNDSAKTIDSWINTSAFALPPVGSLGFDSAPRLIRRPGVNNWDISVFKNFPVGSESRYFHLRLEMFNAWNHTQFSDFNRTVTFNAQGQVTNLPTALGGTGGRFGFGAINTARDPRVIQTGLKFIF